MLLLVFFSCLVNSAGAIIYCIRIALELHTLLHSKCTRIALELHSFQTLHSNCTRIALFLKIALFVALFNKIALFVSIVVFTLCSFCVFSYVVFTFSFRFLVRGPGGLHFYFHSLSTLSSQFVVFVCLLCVFLQFFNLFVLLVLVFLQMFFSFYLILHIFCCFSVLGAFFIEGSG